MNKQNITILVVTLIIVIAVTMGSLFYFNNSNIKKNNTDVQPKITANNTLTLKEVLDSPDKFDGKKITIDCFYNEGNESSLLAATNFDGPTLAQGPFVWAGWSINIPANMYPMLKTYPGVGRNNFTGRVKVEGIFRKTEKGGHLGEYKYTFTISAISVYDENSNKFISVE